MMKQNKDDLYLSAMNDAFADVPDFLQKRLRNWYVGRYQQRWQNHHLFQSTAADATAIRLQSNDYLSLNGHPEIVAAGREALSRSQSGLVMSGIFLPADAAQYQFEKTIAEFMQAEDALVVQSGWCANVSLLQAICDETTPVYIDMMAHLSLWEGARTANAKMHAFRHNDVAHLTRQIKQHGRGVIVVDSIYSTTGDICPLREVAAVAEKQGCLLVVDESHSLGTHGEDGSGLVNQLGLADKVHYRTASLAKAFAARAGLIIGREKHIEYIRYEARPMIFSSALLPHEIAMLLKTLEVIREAHVSRLLLAQKASYLRRQLTLLGYNVANSQSHIIAIEPGPELATMQFRDALETRHVYGAVFCEPATARNRSLIRFTVNCEISMDALDQVIAVCGAVRNEVGMQQWPSTLRLAREQQRTRKVAVGQVAQLPDWQAIAASNSQFNKAA